MDSKKGKFSGKTIVVTGAGSGIGYALCQRLYDAGGIIYAVDINAEKLRLLRESVMGENRITTFVMDVGDRDRFAALVDDVVSQHGKLDYLFNNAGIVIGGDLSEMTTADWNRIVNVNFWGVMHGTDVGYRQMRKQGFGHIVNTSSSAGMLPVPFSSAYAATKHAVVGLSLSLREEAQPFGICVTVVIPGIVETNIFDTATNLKGYDYADKMNHTPFRKVPPAMAANIIIRGVLRNDSAVIFPWYNKLVIRMYQLFPCLTMSLMRRFL